MSGHDSFLDPVEPRVAAAFALRLYAVGTAPGDAGGLIGFGAELASRLDALACMQRWETGTPFLGRTQGVERLGDVLRIVCATTLRQGEAPLGVVFTTLIAARRPEIAIAPPDAPVPETWTMLLGPDGLVDY
jgi:hypothetical protein